MGAILPTLASSHRDIVGTKIASRPARYCDAWLNGGESLRHTDSKQHFSIHKRRKTQSSILYEINERRVMRSILENGPQSRADLARSLSLSFPAVSRVVGAYVDKGWLIELADTTNGEVRNGRPSKLVSVNTKEGPVAIGVELSTNYCDVVIVDLVGNRLRHETISGSAGLDLRSVRDSVLACLQESGIPLSSVLGVGVTGFGRHFERLRSSYISSDPTRRKFEWAGVSVPGYVVERSRAAILGEVWFGQALRLKRAIFIVADDELTVGIAEDGMVNKDNAGFLTLSHIVVNPYSSHRCACGRKGCLGVLLTENLRRLGYLSASDDMAESLKRAQLGLQPEMNYVNRLVEYYAIGITDLCEIIRPDLVVLGGELFVANDYLVQNLLSHLKRTGLFERTTVVSSKFHESAMVMGAASVAVQPIYDYHLLMQEI